MTRFPASALLLCCLPALALVGSACDSGGDDGMGPPPPSATVTFTTPAPTLSQGDTLTVVATASDGSSVIYSSADNAVATVTAAGKVLGVGAGTATITAAASGATATLVVTVQALTPSLSIGAITRNGQPVDPSQLSGAVVVEVSYEVGNAFDGEIVLFLDSLPVGRAPLNGGAGPALSAAGDALGGMAAFRNVTQGVQEVPISISSLNVEQLQGGGVSVTDLISNGPAVLGGQLQVNGGGVGTPASGTAVGIANQPAAYVHLRGLSTQGTNGETVFAPTALDGIYLPRGDGRTLRALDIDIESIEVVRGPQGTLRYGSQASGGVVNVTLDSSRSWTQGGNAVGGIASQRRITGVTAFYTDNTSQSVQLINGLPGLQAPLQGTDAYWDLAGAEHIAYGTQVLPSQTFYVRSGIDFEGYAEASGFGWTGSSPTIQDIGWESSLQCDWRMGPTLSALVPVANSDALTEGQAQFARIDCSGALNTTQIAVGNRWYGDFTPPTGQLLVGANYLKDLDINPTGKSLAFTGTDNLSGFDDLSLSLALRYTTSSGTSFLAGSDDGQGGANLDHVSLTTSGRYGSLGSDAGYYSLDWSYADKGGTLSPRYSLKYTWDLDFPTASIGQTPSSGTAGQELEFTWSLSDAFDLRSSRAWLRYDAQTAIGSLPEVVGQPYDNQWTTQVSGSWKAPLIGSYRTMTNGVGPSGTSLRPEAIYAGGFDAGGNSTYAWEDVSGRYTTVGMEVWKMNAYDWLSLNVGAFTIQAENDTRTVEVEARTAGTPIATVAQLYARQPSAPGDMRWVMFPVSDMVPITVQDNGGWYQEFANPVLDTGKYPLDGTVGALELFAFLFDKDYNVLGSTPKQFTVAPGGGN